MKAPTQNVRNFLVVPLTSWDTAETAASEHPRCSTVSVKAFYFTHKACWKALQGLHPENQAKGLRTVRRKLPETLVLLNHDDPG
jgi:hypothetical protein